MQHAQLQRQPNPFRTGRSLKTRFRMQWPLFVFLLPGLISFMLFCYIPFFGIVMAFQNYHPIKGILGSQWMGLSNFRYIMSLPRFANALRNTIVIGLLKLLINYPAPILFAIFLNEVKKPLFKRINQTISYLPHFISWVVAAGMWYRMLSPSSGVINQVLLMLGIIKNPINFVGEPDAFYPILLITDLWKELGWSAIIYLAAITSISPELYEAARVDGANRLQQTLYITLPGIQPTMILMLVLAVSNLLNVGFDQIYNMTNIVVLEVGEVLDTLILRMLTVGSVRDLSLGTAMGLLKNTIALALFLIANGSSRILFKESLL